jgi:hypothetical protein
VNILKTLAAGAVAAVLLSSCVSYRLQPVAPSGTALKATASRTMAQVTENGVTLEVTAEWAPEIRFDVRAINRGDHSLLLDSNQFRLYSGSLNEWTPVSMISSDEYYRRAERWTSDRVVYVTSQPVYRRTTTTIGGGSITVIENRQVIEPTAVYVDNSGAERLARLKDSLFYTQTVPTGESKHGLVFGYTGRSAYYKLVIPVDGKDFELYFERVKEKTSPFTNVDF